MKDFSNPNYLKKAKIDACFSNSEINKSEIGYAFSNSNPTLNGLKFSKSGADLIKLLNDKKVSLQSKLDSTTASLIASKAILIEQGFSFRSNDDYAENVLYDYRSCNDDHNKLIFNYDDIKYTYNRLKDEIKTCQVIVDNLDVKSNYDLSAPQLVSLQKAVEFDIEKSRDYKVLIQKLYKRQGRNSDGSVNPNAENEWEEESFEKSEGSKGGKVIGHTKSGKPIYENTHHADHKKFSEQDHEDARSVHMKEEITGRNMTERDEAAAAHGRAADKVAKEKDKHKDDVKKALEIIGLTSEEDYSKKKI